MHVAMKCSNEKVICECDVAESLTLTVGHFVWGWESMSIRTWRLLCEIHCQKVTKLAPPTLKPEWWSNARCTRSVSQYSVHKFLLSLHFFILAYGICYGYADYRRRPFATACFGFRSGNALPQWKKVVTTKIYKMSGNSQILIVLIIMIFTVLLLIVRTLSCCYFLDVNTFLKIVLYFFLVLKH